MKLSGRNVALSTVGYTIVTFTIAVLWHVVLFKSQYQELGYFDGEPSFLLGLLAILIQGLMLSLLYPVVAFAGSQLSRILKFTFVVGTFFWTSHVLAFLAKQSVTDAAVFLVMESGYLIVQFGLFACVLGVVYRNDAAT